VAPKKAASGRQQPSRLRVLWLLAAAMLLASTVWTRLAYWQVIQHGYLTEAADAQHVANVVMPAARGLIYDSAGRPVALDTTVYDVSITPPQVLPREREKVALAVAAVLGVQEEDVLAVMLSGKPWGSVARRVPKDKADQLMRMNLDGVWAQPIAQRTYLPGGVADATLAAGLLGFVDFSGHGQSGVEQQYQRQLSGHDGSATLSHDSSGRPIASTARGGKLAVNGADLTLTLDSDVQYAAEQAIADGVRSNHAQSGSVLVMDTKTGGIVAWASSPTYDANRFFSTPPERTRDPVASDVYEPGSVMKVVTLAGGIDMGAISPEAMVDDPGYVTIDGSTIHDWDRRAHGQVSMTTVLEDSLNVGAVKARQMEGRDAFLKYLRAFGFGQPTGVGVAAEANQQLPADSRWANSQLATTAFGQGIAVNMVQMAAAINTVANDGVYVQPQVIQKVGGKPVAAASHRVIKSETADKMKAMMRSVVQHGSGWKARIDGFQLDEAGKTGTSQIPEHGEYSDKHVWASYVGFLPAQNPRFTMLVVVSRPDNGYADANEGYYVSEPIWKRIAEQLILQWHISPEQLPPTPT
jgi:cell division protein FtsI/penicillin-binding protein 2